MTDSIQRQCWCGESQLAPFSAEYAHCLTCGTLVSQAGLAQEQLQVRDDSRDFYGKEYWFSHQTQDLGFTDIYWRARLDLPERCLHWLRTLLAYKLPPAQVLELGCAHGGFVGLLRHAGYDAGGLEMSPWVVEFARRTFDIPMLVGPVEEQQLPDQSLDVIVLNDVLEHLNDPLATLGHCSRLIRPDGLLIIQTPCYPEGTTYAELVAGNDLFLEQIEKKANQHLFLFSRRAIERLLERLGWSELRFEPAMFDYDMYLVAGRAPLVRHTYDQISPALDASASGRVVQALLDKAGETEQLRAYLRRIETDRAARLDVINRLDQKVRQLQARPAESETEQLRARLWASEADRAARLDIINRLNEQVRQLQARLAESEADRAARLEAIEYLKARLVDH